MEKINELREEARKALVDAGQFIESGDAEAAQKAKEDAIAKVEKANELQDTADQIKTLSGDFNKPTNSMPASQEEAKLYNPADNGKDYRNDYKPASWVKGLPAAVQPKWVREQMGHNLKEEENFYKDTWTKWFRDRSPNAQKFFGTASSDELKAMQEGTDSEGGFFVPEDFRTQVIHNTGVPGGVHRPYSTVLTTSLKDGSYQQWAA